MYVYSCQSCGVSDYCVLLSSITCTSLSPLSFSTETRMTSFSLNSLSSDCDFDILLNRQAYLLFEPKRILFCCVTNRSWHGHDERLATHPPFQLSHCCHRCYAAREGVCVCVSKTFSGGSESWWVRGKKIYLTLEQHVSLHVGICCLMK